jgi:predicted DCC family thiol-disulfide oxidoreductase YuxK
VKQATLLYDADCGFCRWSVAKVQMWDRSDRLRPLPLQAAEADRLLGGMDEASKMASWHLVTLDGDVYSAGAAVSPLARLLPGGRPIAAIASAFPRSTDLAYRWVARHRDRLGAMLGAKACAVDPARR